MGKSKTQEQKRLERESRQKEAEEKRLDKKKGGIKSFKINTKKQIKKMILNNKH